MSVNVSILTDTAKAVSAATVKGYGDGVAAHTTRGWEKHNQSLVYATPYLDAAAHTSAVYSLRVSLTDSGGVDLPLILPINATGSTVVSGAPPTIISQPQNVVVAAGNPAQFFVGVISDTPVSYRWFKGGVAVSTGTASKLVFPSVKTSFAGAYYATAQNSNGSVVSSAGTLTIGSTGGYTGEPGFELHDVFWPF